MTARLEPLQRLEPPHTVGGAIARRARRAPGKPALTGDEGSVSYAALAAAIAAVRQQLEEAGLRREDRIAALLPPSLAGARLLVSLACNVTVLPLDPATPPDALDTLADAIGIRSLARAAPDGALLLEQRAPARQPAALRPTRGADVALLMRARRALNPVTHRQLRSLAPTLQREDGAGSLIALHEPGIEAALFVPLILGESVTLHGQKGLLLAPVVAGTQHQTAAVPSSPAPRGDLPGPGPDDDLLELEVRALWQRLLLRDDIALDENFFEAGGDSLLATQMLLELEALSGRPYPQSGLADLTIRRIASVLRERMPDEQRCVTAAKAGDVWQRARSIRRMARMLKDRERGWVSAPESAGSAPLFFCHGDFQARGLYAHQLAALLPQDQAVYLLHPQREPAAGTTAEQIAERYFEEVAPIAQDQPLILGGYCNGGFVAWHLAHMLKKRGIEVAAVFLVETPSLNARPALRRAAQSLRAAGRLLPGRLGRVLREEAMRAVWSLYRHGAWQFAARLWSRVRARVRRSGAPGPVPSWWVFVRGMATRYLPPPIDVDVYCFVAEEGSATDTEPACWRALARSVTEVKVPGSHVSAVISHRRALATAFTRAISEAAPRTRSRAAPAAQAG